VPAAKRKIDTVHGMGLALVGAMEDDLQVLDLKQHVAHGVSAACRAKVSAISISMRARSVTPTGSWRVGRKRRK
jgi:hypothetical protein